MKISFTPIITFSSCILSAFYLVQLTYPSSISLTPAIQQNSHNLQDSQTDKQNLHFLQNTLQKNLFNAQRSSLFSAEKDTSMQNTQSTRSMQNTIPISSLNWKLLGTMVNDVNQDNSYVIMNINDKDKIYKNGTKINNWTIANVERESILLEQGNKIERLLLRKSSRTQNVDKKININKNSMQAIFNNPTQLLTLINLTPYKDDSIQGLKITSIDNKSNLNMLGLQANDVLLAINDNPLNSYESLKYFQELTKKNEALLKIYRNQNVVIYKYIIQ